MSKRILIVDDEKSILESLEGILSDEGFDTVIAESAGDGLKIIDSEHVDLVLLDIWMPGMDGLTALEQIKERDPMLPVIMISGHGNIETAVRATKMGAFDFIEKPPSYDKIVVAVNNGLQLSHLVEENEILRSKSRAKPGLTGNSQAVKELKEQIAKVAPTSSWVLIHGEHGTGKEVVAQAIHQSSQYADKPMVELNCAAIPEELIESELFGHEKGAFSGAVSSHRGKFDQADGGMLFLDEIGDMSLKTQAKILRILQEQKFERVGGNKTITVDVRVLAATNKDLVQEIEKGNFRADLFYRLNVVPIEVPPLRERVADIPKLVDEILEEMARKGLGEKKIASDALKILQSHSWPGNVRELRNFVERAVIMASGDMISAEGVAVLLSHSSINAHGGGREVVTGSIKTGNFRDARKQFEKEFLQTRLAANNGNISKTSEDVGLERSHLHKKLKSLEIIK